MVLHRKRALLFGRSRLIRLLRAALRLLGSGALGCWNQRNKQSVKLQWPTEAVVTASSPRTFCCYYDYNYCSTTPTGLIAVRQLAISPGTISNPTTSSLFRAHENYHFQQIHHHQTHFERNHTATSSKLASRVKTAHRLVCAKTKPTTPTTYYFTEKAALSYGGT